MYVDYRRVNSLTEKDAYALPPIDNILSYIGKNKVLSTIDLFSGYHQVPMYPEDQDITCFTTQRSMGIITLRSCPLDYVMPLLLSKER